MVMTLETPISRTFTGSAVRSPAGIPIAPVATIVPCPGIRRGTEATVPIPPGLVRVMLAPV